MIVIFACNMSSKRMTKKINATEKSCLMINLIIEAKVIVKTGSMAKELKNTSFDVIKTQLIAFNKERTLHKS